MLVGTDRRSHHGNDERNRSRTQPPTHDRFGGSRERFDTVLGWRSGEGCRTQTSRRICSSMPGSCSGSRLRIIWSCELSGRLGSIGFETWTAFAAQVSRAGKSGRLRRSSEGFSAPDRLASSRASQPVSRRRRAEPVGRQALPWSAANVRDRGSAWQLRGCSQATWHQTGQRVAPSARCRLQRG